MIEQDILDHPLHTMRLVTQEAFGPVWPIIRCKDGDCAIRISNGTVCGLSSGVCTYRLDSTTRFVSDCEVGSVSAREVPDHRLELTPLGGSKDAGPGYKEGVQQAIKRFTNIKSCSLHRA